MPIKKTLDSKGRDILTDRDGRCKATLSAWRLSLRCRAHEDHAHYPLDYIRRHKWETGVDGAVSLFLIDLVKCPRCSPAPWFEHLGRVTQCPRCRLTIFTENNISQFFISPGSGESKDIGGLKDMKDAEKSEEVQEIDWDDLDGLSGAKYDKLPEGKTIVVFKDLIGKPQKVETKFGDRIILKTEKNEWMIPIYVAQEINKIKKKGEKQAVIRRQGKDKDTKYFVSED